MWRSLSQDRQAGLKIFGFTQKSFQKVMTPGDRSRPVARSCLNGSAKRIYRSLYSNRVGGGRHWDTSFKECIINSNHYRNKYCDFLFLKISQVIYCTRIGPFCLIFSEFVGKNAVAAANEKKGKKE